MYKIIEAFLNKESHHINLKLPFDTKGHLAQQSLDLAKLQHHRPNQSNQPRAIIIMCLSTRNLITSYAMRRMGEVLGVSAWGLGFRVWTRTFSRIALHIDLHFSVCLFFFSSFALKVKIY